MNLPDLRDGRCQVWSARTSQARPELTDDLDRVERDRLSAYRRTEDRDRFVLGCAIVRRVLGAHLGIAPAAVRLDRTCPDCGRPHGKVRVDGPEPVRMSVSHSGDLVLVAFHRDTEIGVDVEQVDPDLDTAALAGVVLADAEVEALAAWPATDRPRIFTTYWTRKEAVVKATGRGIRSDLRELVVSTPGAVEGYAGPLGLSDLEAGPGYAAALAVLADRSTEIETLDATGLLV